MKEAPKQADVCLLLEGTYPYVSGGVSSWVHDIIGGLPELNFHLVSLLPNRLPRKHVYAVPPNVIGLTDVYINALPPGWPWLPGLKSFFRSSELYLQNRSEEHTSELQSPC